MSYEHIIVDRPAEGVGRVQLNRPKALNALNSPLMDEVNDAMLAFNSDASIGAMILTGDDKAFAAGADIKEMDGKTQIDMLMTVSLVDRFDIKQLSEAGHRRRFRLCAGRRLRDRDGLRHDRRIGDGTSSGSRRSTWASSPARAARSASDARGGQGAGDGDHADRPQAGRGRSAALWAGQSRGAAG